jgi:hypothetical protein
MDVNRAIDDLIHNLEPLNRIPLGPRSHTTSSSFSQRRICIIYYKSEDGFDRLLQVGGGFGSSTTSQRRIWIIYHKSVEDLDCLLQVGGGLASIHRRAPVPADYSDFINDALPLSNGYRGLMPPPPWSGGSRHWKGTSPPSYPAQPTFLCLHLGRADPGIGRARALQATRLSPPFCISIFVGQAWALKGHESSKLPSSAHLSVLSTWSGGLRHQSRT